MVMKGELTEEQRAALQEMCDCQHALNRAFDRLSRLGIDVEVETVRLVDCADPSGRPSLNLTIEAFFPRSRISV